MGEEFSGIGSSLFIGHLEQSFGRMEELKLSKTVPSLIPSIEEPCECKDERKELRGHPRQVFSTSFTCDLPDSAEAAEALRDMMRREVPDMEFDVQILPSLYKKCYGRAPRKMLKAMNHGGYYKRNTKWKRKAIALYDRYPEQSPFTICNAKMKIEENGEVLILGRGVSKTQVLKQRRSKSLC